MKKGADKKKSKLEKKVSDLLVLNINKKGSKEKLAKALSGIKWLKRFEPEEITVEILEKCFLKVCKKYPAEIGYIQKAGDDSWAIMLKRTDSGKWIATVYAITLFESLAKALIILFAHFEKEIAFHHDD